MELDQDFHIVRTFLNSSIKTCRTWEDTRIIIAVYNIHLIMFYTWMNRTKMFQVYSACSDSNKVGEG